MVLGPGQVRARPGPGHEYAARARLGHVTPESNNPIDPRKVDQRRLVACYAAIVVARWRGTSR